MTLIDPLGCIKYVLSPDLFYLFTHPLRGCIKSMKICVTLSSQGNRKGRNSLIYK
jgi:hypothetical protein